MSTSDVWSSERGRAARRKLLQRAAAGDDHEMAELAREILAGRMEFRDVMHSSAYSEILRARWQPTLDAWQRMPEREREDASAHAGELIAEALSAIEELPDETTRTARPAPARPTPEEVDDEDFEQRTYLRRR